MVANAIGLVLFPAVMAFAASSDLLTMTISNRVSLILIAGFFVLALASGMTLPDILSHLGAGALVLVVAFGCFARGWIAAGMPSLRLRPRCGSVSTTFWPISSTPRCWAVRLPCC